MPEPWALPRNLWEGKSAFDLYPKDQAELYWKDDLDVIRSGKPKMNIIESVNIKGSTLWVQTDKMPYRDGKGSILGIVGFTIDITERKRAEKMIYDSAVKFRTIYMSSKDAIMIVKPGGSFIDGNPAAIQIFGCADEKDF